MKAALELFAAEPDVTATAVACALNTKFSRLKYSSATWSLKKMYREYFCAPICAPPTPASRSRSPSSTPSCRACSRMALNS